MREHLDARGFAVTEPLLDGDECRRLAGLFDGEGFRSTIDMARHRFGEGRYCYFDHPLPAEVQALRPAFYRHLAPIANAWSALLGDEEDAFPPRHEASLRAAARRVRGAPRRFSCVVFPTRHRPQRGARGHHRVGLRHGVSTVTSGSRTALGIIFHDAR